MLPLWIFLTCVMTAAYAQAVEHPTRHRDRPLEVNVNRRYMVMYPGDTLTVRCRAKIGKKTQDIAEMNFGLQLSEQTIVPLSSNLPGITITPSAPSHRSREEHSYHKVVKYLTLDQDIYRFLNYGENKFFCHGRSRTSRGVDYGIAYFTIKKMY